jgi:uncharacterized protein YjhX (UPF0386 family)
MCKDLKKARIQFNSGVRHKLSKANGQIYTSQFLFRVIKMQRVFRFYRQLKQHEQMQQKRTFAGMFRKKKTSKNAQLLGDSFSQNPKEDLSLSARIRNTI